jgi:RNA polymerase sigma factor (sigma-70 family)
LLPPVPTEELPEIDPRLPSALAALSKRQRTAVLLVHAYGWTHGEVAGALGCSESTVRNHLDRGVRRLRASLGDNDA